VREEGAIVAMIGREDTAMMTAIAITRTAPRGITMKTVGGDLTQTDPLGLVMMTRGERGINLLDIEMRKTGPGAMSVADHRLLDS
jgi:hypothetical protein